MRDSIDFGDASIPHVFKKIFMPTFLGMIISAVFVITDGIFVGQGLGANALAAVNIVAPIWLLSTGIGLMFGMGASVLIALHMERGKHKVARIVLTQAVILPTLFLFLLSGIIMMFPIGTLNLLGCSESLHQLGVSYMYGFIPFMAFNALLVSCAFFVRQDGSPIFAMFCGIFSSLLNVVFDYLFIFVFKWGIFGAGVATSLGTLGGVVLLLIYLLDKRRQLSLTRIKLSKKSLILTIRNLGYICRLGFSALIYELSIACMILCGNYVFMDNLGINGVAAFGIACYFFPLVFMLYTAVAQSAQPIMSFNYGTENPKRVKKAYVISLQTSLWFGMTFCLLTFILSDQIVGLFINSHSQAYEIAAGGLPLFSLGFIGFAVNIVSVSFFQSVDRPRCATCTTILRGFIFMIAAFLIMPKLMPHHGIWLAVPVAESLTALTVLLLYNLQQKKSIEAES